jgi:hypothetical protein
LTRWKSSPLCAINQITKRARPDPRIDGGVLDVGGLAVFFEKKINLRMSASAGIDDAGTFLELIELRLGIAIALLGTE